MAELEPGSEFAGCRIEGVLGRGGMGVIYRATEVRLGRPVALKLIATEQASDPDVRERFEREARLTASIDHPNVVPVYAAGEEDGHLYLVMRYVPGTDLQALLRREGRLAPDRAAGIVAQIADALDAAHQTGLVHRDVKPANVLIAAANPPATSSAANGADGWRGHVYLSDFGITRVQSADTRITDSGGWIGTVDFMAPEHLRGEPTDARSDVYALGCVLHSALTGTPPFRRETVPATITAHLHEAPPRPSETPGVPEAFDSVIARALAKEPAGRYPSAGDLGRAARAAATGAVASTARGSVATGAATPEHAEPTRLAPAAGATAVATPPAPPTAVTRVAGGPDPGDGTGAGRGPGSGRPEAVRIQHGRRRKLALAATVLVLALPTILIVRWAAGWGSSTSTGPLSAGEVRDVARSFADAYTNEDDAALRRILTPAVRRVSPNDVQRGRPAVVGEYRRQFAADDVQRYALDGLQATGGMVGRAAGRYTVTRKGAPPITGKLVLGVVRRDGRAVIDQIDTEPRA
ncbi:protein kinase [Baekduia soli]|uniref:non-specific serine/threonine protein kinase n=1 Tax=Baekduia soli TaxID=496014 RepID=A0A5B8TZQ5_9ACTN|nr:serine/threonine-protein kinase [Baekduia soli]QEC46204.1 protein kinase [Baekduia soli]